MSAYAHCHHYPLFQSPCQAILLSLPCNFFHVHAGNVRSIPDFGISVICLSLLKYLVIGVYFNLSIIEITLNSSRLVIQTRSVYLGSVTVRYWLFDGMLSLI